MIERLLIVTLCIILNLYIIRIVLILCSSFKNKSISSRFYRNRYSISHILTLLDGSVHVMDLYEKCAPNSVSDLPLFFSSRFKTDRSIQVSTLFIPMTAIKHISTNVKLVCKC